MTSLQHATGGEMTSTGIFGNDHQRNPRAMCRAAANLFPMQICFQVFLIFLFAKFLLWGPAHCIVRFGGLGIGAGCSVVAAGKLFPKLEKYREEKGDRVKSRRRTLT